MHDLSDLPKHFRVIGDRFSDDESFIPAYRGFIENLSTRELSQSRKAAMAGAEAKRLAERLVLKARHDKLVRRHVGSSIVETLLRQHAPVEVLHGHTAYLECHACPDYYVTEYDVTDKAEWPCPTWQTIADGGENGDK